MSTAEYIELSGTVAAVIYQNEENGFTILRLDAGGENPVTVTGCIPCASPGEHILAAGTWSKHPAHGEQFKAEWVEYRLPAGDRAIHAYLASGAIKGIGPAFAGAIVERFGAGTLDIIDAEPEKLTLVKGISPKKAREIGNTFRRQAGIRLLIEFLTQYGLRPALAMRLYKCYGEEAMAAVRNNPYILADAYFGGDFTGTDRAAIQLGFPGDCPERLMAAVLYELEHNLNNGHCFIPRDKLARATSSLIHVSLDACDEALDKLIAAKKVVSAQVAGIDACYLERLYEAETYVSEKLKRLAHLAPETTPDTEDMIRRVETDAGLVLAESQRAAVDAAARQHVMVLTGAPGTGKTTTVRAMIALFEQMDMKIALTAPTGRAARRMSELCHRDAVTIHRLLGAGYSGEAEETVFQRCESDPIEADVVILDEASMVDILLAKSLLAALPPACRLIFVGDADQLPPIGPGNLFSDIVRSGVLETVRLTEIFRQAGESGVIVGAHKINRGEEFNLKENAKDFFFLERKSPAAIADTIVDLCARRLPENMGISPHQIQVLSPFKNGETGTYTLNKRLQSTLNPTAEDRREKIFGEFIFREGDKVMQIRNNYDIIWKKEDQSTGLGVYNGDIGMILRIDPREEILTVDFDDRLVSYSFDALGDLEPAYAMTVHKSQGSEYRAVVLAAGDGPKMLLSRKVLYTAVTRARELLIIVGDGQIVKAMIRNDSRQKRYSGLKSRLAGA